MSIEERKAILVIRNYLNKELSDDEILSKYELAVDQLIQNADKIQGSKRMGIKSISEGQQSISYESGIEAWTITPDVKALLPAPYVKMY